MVTAVPAMFTVPARPLLARFADTVSVTVWEPLPLPPLATLIHPTLLAAVHAHPPPVFTVTLTDCPSAAAAMLCVDTE